MRLRFIAVVAVLAIPLLVLIVRRPSLVPDAGRAARGTQWVSSGDSTAARLPLDRRFVSAVGDIRAILTGRPTAGASATFADGRWWISVGRDEVGSTTALPGFLELEGVLAGWARAIASAEGHDPSNFRADRTDVQAAERWSQARKALDRLDPETALRGVDAAWMRGVRSPDDAAIAAAALTLMSVVAVDRMGTADELTAQALAAVAIAEVSGPPLRRERVLLAHVLGYDDDARREALSLSENDPVRAFVLGDSSALEAAARAPGARGIALVLWPLHLAGRDHRDLWVSEVEQRIERDRESELMLLATGLAVDPSTEDAAAAARTPWDLRVIRASLARLTGEGTGPGGLSSMGRSDLVSMAERFERSLADLPASADGAFLDRTALRAFYRTTFYSALARFAQPAFAAVAAGSALASAEGAEPSLPAGRAIEFGAWCTAMAEASGESGNPHRALLRLRLLRWFGAPALLAVYDSLEQRLPENDPALEEARRAIIELIDGRPSNLRLLGRRPG